MNKEKNDFKNIYFEKDNLYLEKDNNYGIINMGSDLSFIISDKFIHLTKTGKYSIGLKKDWDYSITYKGVRKNVKGKTLLSLYFKWKESVKNSDTPMKEEDIDFSKIQF